jgi:DNA-directed RNA polymerase I, II, and III subunit RPABC1
MDAYLAREVRANVAKMMGARGLVCVESDVFANEEQRVLVVYTEKLSVAHLREHVAAAVNMRLSGLLFVTPAAPGAVMRQAIAECCGVVRVEVFAQSELAFDLMAHELVPKMRVVTDAEKRELLARYKMRITQMPRMLAKDPCSRYLNLTRGTVVCITRQPPDAEAYATYRVVV